MAHSDDKGLVLPAKIASIKVVITTVGATDREAVHGKAKEISIELKKAGIENHIDDRDLRPGEKFYEWERKGIPVRIELGPKDLASNSAILVRRDTGDKKKVELNKTKEEVKNLLDDIQDSLYKKALIYRTEKTKTVDTWDNFVKEIEAGNFVLAHWSGDRETEAEIKKESGATIRCTPFDQKKEVGKCIKSGKPSDGRVIFAKAY